MSLPHIPFPLYSLIISNKHPPSLGQDPEDAQIDKMLAEAPGKINFTMFLTLFGEKMTGTDPEDTIRNAFACFDPENTGKLDEER